MGGVCVWCAGSCKPVWPVFIILASLPCVLHCSDSPAAAVGKMYPRGNHWAVGHLMGKKSIERLPEPQETDSDYLTASDTAEPVELSSFERLAQALLRHTGQKQMKPHIAQRLLGPLRSGWREEDRDKYLREMSELHLLALKLQDDDAA